jgi:hypothetical protein
LRERGREADFPATSIKRPALLSFDEKFTTHQNPKKGCQCKEVRLAVEDEILILQIVVDGLTPRLVVRKVEVQQQAPRLEVS